MIKQLEELSMNALPPYKQYYMMDGWYAFQTVIAIEQIQ